MIPIKYSLIQEFKAEVNGIEINDENLYWILTITVDKLNKALKHIDVKKQNEFIFDIIDLIDDLYLDICLTVECILTSISKNLEDFKLTGNNDLSNRF